MPHDKMLSVFVASLFKLLDENFGATIEKGETTTGSHKLIYKFGSDEFNIVITRSRNKG